MPHKEAIKQKAKSNSATPIKKSQYKVINCSAYNKSLKKLGKLSLYFPKGDLRSQFINDESYSKGVAGRTWAINPSWICAAHILYVQPARPLDFYFLLIFDKKLMIKSNL